MRETLWPARRRRGSACGVVAALAVLLAPVGVARGEVRVAGSDVLGDAFTRELLAFGVAQRAPIAVAFEGSRRGWEVLAQGRADLALVVGRAEEPAAREAFAATTIGYVAVLVAVPAACPLAEISLPQLARVFDAAISPLPPAWREFGASGPWAESTIVPVAAGPNDDMGVNLFRQLVLGGGELRHGTRRYANGAELAARFSSELRPIALLAHPRQCPATAKLLGVARDESRPAFLPTRENLELGRYPLCVPLQVVHRRERGGELAALLAFLRGEAAARALAAANIIAAGPTAGGSPAKPRE